MKLKGNVSFLCLFKPVEKLQCKLNYVEHNKTFVKIDGCHGILCAQVF